nr:MAG TPA: hypothetical protein [Caudoviricetes sp.]
MGSNQHKKECSYLLNQVSKGVQPPIRVEH